MSITLEEIRNFLLRPCIVVLVGTEMCVLVYILGIYEAKDSQNSLTQRVQLLGNCSKV